jgi:glycosyltransferase involved in cell wall biosynthesis
MMPAASPVLHVHKFLFDRGGLERYLFLVLDLLRSRGHDVVTLGMADARNRERGDGTYLVDPVRFPERPGPGNALTAARGLARAIYSSQAYRVTRRLIDERRPRVAHVHELHHHLSPSVLVALREAGVPVVMSAHEYKLACPTVHLFDGKGVCEACRGHRYWQPLLRRCSHGSLTRSAGAALEAAVHHGLRLYDERHVGLIACGSEFTKAKLAEFGYAPSRLTLLPYQHDLTAWPRPTAPIGEHIAFAGRLVAYKGVATLIRALALAGDPPAVIAGAGPEREALERHATDAGLRRLRFAGFVDDDELRALLGTARAVVVPSEVLETFGYAAYEAMLLGRPVIASDLGPLPELVTPETGLLFPPGDERRLAEHIRTLANDAALAARMGRAGRAAAEARTDLDRHYERLTEIYEEVMTR